MDLVFIWKSCFDVGLKVKQLKIGHRIWQQEVIVGTDQEGIKMKVEASLV